MKQYHPRLILWTILISSVFSMIMLGGCSSYFRRKDCESTNWYAHGQTVAMSGKRLSGDPTVQGCREVEAEINAADLDRGFKQGMSLYCAPEKVFSLGKAGDFFSSELCDGDSSRLLIEKHRAGVAEYCMKTNGYSAGASGRPYNSICPKDLERDFLPEFRRGRKKYFTVLVAENEKRIVDIDRDVLRLQAERAHKHAHAQHLHAQTSLIQENVVDPKTGAAIVQMVRKQTDEQKRAADNMDDQVRRLDAQMSNLVQEQAKLRDRNREIRLESVALDDQGN